MPVFDRGGQAGGDPLEEKAAELREANPGLDIRVPKQAKPWHRVAVWLVLTWLVGGAVPIGSTIVHALNTPHQKLDFFELLGKGDLIVVALLASLAAFGDLALAFAQSRARFTSVFWPWFLLVSELILIATTAGRVFDLGV